MINIAGVVVFVDDGDEDELEDIYLWEVVCARKRKASNRVIRVCMQYPHTKSQPARRAGTFQKWAEIMGKEQKSIKGS